MAQHADYSTNIFKDSESVKNVVELMNDFSKVAGQKLNIDKSECILLGPLKIHGKA